MPLMDGLLDVLDRQASTFEGLTAQKPKFELAESQLRGPVLETVDALLRKLGYPTLSIDKRPVQKMLPARGKVSFHRLETEEGSVALVHPPEGTLTTDEGWEKVLLLFQALADHGIVNVFVFTQTTSDSDHPFYRVELWPSLSPKPPNLFQRAERFPGEQLDLLSSLDEDDGAEQLRRWLGLREIPPPDPNTQASDGFHYPEVLRRHLGEVFISFGEHPFREIFRRVAGKLPNEVVQAPSFQERVHKLIDTSDRNGTLKRLVYGVRLALPDNVELLDLVAEHFDLESTRLRKKDVEKMLGDKNIALAPAVYRSRQGRRELQVCRVEIKGDAKGTGFLVAPDVVLTNYHVVEPVFEKPGLASRLRFRFDYKLNEDGSELHPGELYGAHEDWEVDSSRYNQGEKEGIVGVVAGPDELDHALVRLAKPAGALPVGGTVEEPDDADPGPGHEDAAEPRGFVDLRTAVEVDKHDMLQILQYPAGRDLRMTVQHDGAIGWNDPHAKTRLRYANDTLPGSSGSPCFDAEWQIVAMHHLGDATYEGFQAGGFQQGVPIHRIVERLQREGKLDQLYSDDQGNVNGPAPGDEPGDGSGEGDP